MDFSDEQKVDTEVISGVNSIVPRMDQEYKAVTPINIVEPMVQIQEASSGEEKINELLENDDPEITRMWNEDYGMINHPINVVENPAMEVDDVEVQIQEAAGVGSVVLEFENTMPENNLPKEPALLQQDCPFGVNEDRIASFVGLLSDEGKPVYELISGTPLWEDADVDDVLNKIEFEEPKFQNSKLSNEVQDFLEKCLNSSKVANKRKKKSDSMPILDKPIQKIIFKINNHKFS
ncbi:hypothetical protein H5410_021862, partial [Solanum commersonii]